MYIPGVVGQLSVHMIPWHLGPFFPFGGEPFPCFWNEM